jgi:hypothetical protein
MKMGYYDEELLPDVPIPQVSKQMERQIGAFFVAWAALENELDIAYPVFFRVDPTLAVSLYANVGTQAKIDALMSAVGACALFIGAREVRSAHAILDRIRELNDRARNTLAHMRLLQFVDRERKRKSAWKIVRYAARRQQSWAFHPNEVKHWRRLTKAVMSAARAWHRKMRRLYGKLKKFKENELAEKLLIHEREAQPIQFRRPTKKRTFQQKKR